MTASHTREINGQRRAQARGGWIGIIRGESQGAAVERALPDLNADGYKVAFIIPDKFSFAKMIWAGIVAVCTLGFYWPTASVLIIGERVDD